VEIKITLALPRDEVSIPVVRRMLTTSMTVLGVDPTSVHDVAVAVSEACTNVLEHAADGAEYEVAVGIDDNLCVIEVLDKGGGFDARQAGRHAADLSAEQGRGIHLMRHVVDQVRFERRPGRGTVVHLEKRLVWQQGALVPRLSSNGSGSNPPSVESTPDGDGPAAETIGEPLP